MTTEELIEYLRKDADSWEQIGWAVGLRSDADIRRNEERIAYLRGAADQLEKLQAVLDRQQ